MTTPSQLTLPVKPVDDSRFDNYFVSETNRHIVSSLQNSSEEDPLIFLWGGAGLGKSHLLQALAADSAASFYVSFKDREMLEPGLFDDLSQLTLVCLDDIELIAGDSNWETAIFKLFNEIKAGGGRLLISSNMAPLDLPLMLADLKSRLQSMLIFHLGDLEDSDKKQALQLRAIKRGFELSDAVADYIMLRAGRSLNDLMSVLEQLDNKTLQTQRRLTIPLVRETLGW